MEKRSRHWYWKIIAAAGIIMLVFAPLAYISSFATWYADHVYPLIQAVLGRATGWFPFALGEVLMYVCAVYVAVTVVIVIVFGIRALVRRGKKRKPADPAEEADSVESGKPRSRFFPRYMKVFLACVVIGLWLYVFNWWIPYHDYVLSEEKHKKEFSFDVVFYAHNELARMINEASAAAPRDASGRIIYPSREEAWDTVVRAMRSISGEYGRLKGYYPQPKVAMCSDVLDWMNIGGYTYPYTVELTYNKYVDNLYFYDLLAHEASHHKGYYKENEAMYLSFRACLASDDPLMNLGGLWDPYWRVYEALAELSEITEIEATDEIRRWFASNYVEISDQAYADIKGAVLEAKEAYEQDEHPLEEYHEVAEQAADVGWETQAELIEEYSYDDVLQLILEYYESIMPDSARMPGQK